ncbi:MAG: GspH/FimT family pseudopilin [Moraxellaceae bacterium]|nr:GspH/FimT family pseudopilin [Moraxellaceae bacterium]
MKSAQGFTLPELLVVVAIIGIMLSIASDGWKKVIARQHAVAAINQVAEAARLARHTALTRRQIITVCPSPDGVRCSSDWTQPLFVFASNSTVPDHENFITIFPAITHGKMKWKGFGGTTRLQYQRNGLTLAQNGTFVYCPDDDDAKLARALIINKSGRQRVAEDLDNDGIVDLRPGEPVRCPS